MFVTAEAMPGIHIVKPGTLDDLDVLNAGAPGAEIFTKDRVEWCGAIKGTAQQEAGS